MKSRGLRRQPRRNQLVRSLVLGLIAGIGFFGLVLVGSITPTVVAQEAPKKNKDVAKVAKSKVAPSTTEVNYPGKGQKLDALALARLIDQEINNRLKAEKIPASPRSSDTEFLRRIYLDLVGVIPSVDKVEEFLKNSDPNKRAKVIEQLLADSRFGVSQAEIWSGLMLPRESNNRRLDHSPMHKWLTAAFNSNMPLDKFTYEIVTSVGDIDKNGAATFFVGNPTVDKVTDNISRTFLGVQLQCAQCHNHPFTDYKQNDYWGMAAFFMKTRITTNPNAAAKKGISPGVVDTNVTVKGKGLPEAAKFLPPKFLQADQPQMTGNEPLRPVVAKWMTSPSNPFFAKAMVNRFWYHFFGRGLVNPVDDMHDDNQPTHPELLMALAEQLKANSFDLKYLIRALCNSEAYQRTSQPLPENKDDLELYSHRTIRVLSPEQLYDSLQTVLRTSGDKSPATNRRPAGKKGGNPGSREAFLNFFRIEEGNDPTEFQAGIPQALRLMNSAATNQVGETVNLAVKNGKNPQEVIEQLFLVSLSRRPTPEEVGKMQIYLTKVGDPRTAYNDILWALLNSSEFILNH